MSEEAEVQAAAAGIAALEGVGGVAERLGGLTNRVYRLGDFCLRLPGAGTEEYIDRSAELVAAGLASDLSVSPELVHGDAATGVLVTRFIQGAVTMTPAGFRTIAGSPGRAAEAFRRLHGSGAAFPTRFELFAMIDSYLAVLSTKDVALPEGYHDVLAEAEAVRRALARHPVPLDPCHCDPLCENFLDTGDRMWIVDWEYSGMNDPMWDLGDLSVEAEFAPWQEEEMLAAYFGGAVPETDRARMVLYKAMCDLLWTLWGLIQLAAGNPADDFRAYADGRFARCRALMATQDFATALAILSR